MKTIILTRKQIEKLYELIDVVDDDGPFEIHYDQSSGIGPVVKVNRVDYKSDVVDITDLESW